MRVGLWGLSLGASDLDSIFLSTAIGLSPLQAPVATGASCSSIQRTTGMHQSVELVDTKRRMGKKSYYAKCTLNLLLVHDCMAHELKL